MLLFATLFANSAALDDRTVEDARICRNKISFSYILSNKRKIALSKVYIKVDFKDTSEYNGHL